MARTRSGHKFPVIRAARLVDQEEGNIMAITILPKKPAAKPAAKPTSACSTAKARKKTAHKPAR